MASDEAIQMTNSDASNAKAYAVSKGYWTDPYLVHFVPAAFKPATPQNPVEHKPPEMSRGYYARVSAIRSVVYKFLRKHPPPAECQVINLGCGYDTLYFELCERQIQPRKYVEVDFGRIVTSKIRAIKSKRALSDKVWPPSQTAAAATAATAPLPAPPINPNDPFKVPALPPMPSFPPGSNNEINTEKYHLVNCDLRNMAELERKLITQCELDPNRPTLVISECVFVYMTPQNSHDLLSFLARTFHSCALVSYEQVNMSDKFGSIMLANMEMRSCKLYGVEACASLKSQHDRFERAGFGGPSQILTMTDYYKTRMDQAERQRIESIEFLDESELLFQLMDHYCICLVTNSDSLADLLF